MQTVDIVRPTGASQRNVRIMLILFSYAFFLLLIVGGDGWFRFPIPKDDGAWFFMGGKSLFNGLVPYVDFTDSKGPLLWLIYGLGYLISPFDFYGVFFIEVLFYSLTFYVVYKTVLLVGCREYQAVVVAMLMPSLYFYPGIHTEIRAEDFCHLPQALVFYVVVAVLFDKRVKEKYFIWLGVCCGYFLFLKYSYFFTTLVPVALLLIYICLRPLPKVRLILSVLAGFLLIAVPVSLWLWSAGALKAFVEEYLINTGHTIVIGSKDPIYIELFKKRWPGNIWYIFRMEKYYSEFMRITGVGLCFTLYLFRQSRWMAGVLLLWYGASVGLFTYYFSYYYCLLLSVFAFGLVVFISKIFKDITVAGSLITGAVILFLITILSVTYPKSKFYDFKSHEYAAWQQEELGELMKIKSENLGRTPTLSFYNTLDKGEHVGPHAIAGTKYWAAQVGMTPAMSREHVEDIFVFHPDFVVVESRDKEGIKRLEEDGYELIREYNFNGRDKDKATKGRRLYFFVGKP